MTTKNVHVRTWVRQQIIFIFIEKNMKNHFFQILLVLIVPMVASAQDKAHYKDRESGFYQDSILPAINDFNNSMEKAGETRYLTMDFDHVKAPRELEDYNPAWHNAPLSQGATGTCWCFASISFLESEIYRQTGRKVKLSEMYMVYWEYVARAVYFVDHRGDMYFGQGSETNAVIRNMREHGLVPAGQYTGLKQGQRFYDHGGMEAEIKAYLDFAKANNIWDKKAVISNVRSILDQYMGTPPETVTVDGTEMSPLAYMSEVLKLQPDDYFSFMSTKSMAYNQKGELIEPDNWWHCDNYYNLTLEDFGDLLPLALDKGYTLSFCGDVSEPGYDRYAEIGIIPTFDIPEAYINADAREFRLVNGSTTDDHCMHIIGYTVKNGKRWYLLKDSSSSAFDGPHRGYRFIREDYVKLKVIALMTHKYAVPEILDRIIK